MSPFRTGNENFPENDQGAANKNTGLTYPPVEGHDSDDAGNDFVNVHLDFFPADYIQARDAVDESVSYRAAYQKSIDNKIHDKIVQLDLRGQLDEGALDLLADTVRAHEIARSKRAGDFDFKMTDVTARPDALLMRSLRERLTRRDEAWQKKHRKDFNQHGIETSMVNELAFLPDNVMAPILVNAYLP